VSTPDKYKNALLSGPYPSPIPYIPRRGYAEYEGRQVHFRDTGKGSPLLLCHQAPCTSRQFTNVYELLSNAGIRAIGVDMPGYGESDPHPFVPCIEDYAPAIVSVLDHLGIEKSDILGHHTGAIIASEISVCFPDRINKIILNGPFLPENEDDRKKWVESAKKEIDFEYSADGSQLTKRFSWPSAACTNPKTLTRRSIEQFQGYAPYWTG
jgi:pimeloyl-ACP methyl ester carboxylesterase